MDASTPVILDYSPAAVVRASQREALLSIAGFWLFYYVLNTIHMALTEHADQGPMLLRRAAVVVVGMSLTCLLYLLLRRLEGKSMRVLVAAVFLAAVPVAVANGAINYTAFYIAYPSPAMLQDLTEMEGKHETTRSVISEYAVEWYFFIVAWCAFYLALAYASKVRLAERRIAAYRAEAQAAELRALRYQVNPHFLFNTLNSLSTLVLRQRTADAERMIMNLSTFFRTSLATDAVDDIPLSEEIRTQQLYLDIEQVRFPARLLVKIDVPEDLAAIPVPSLILQPLVENAIKHGVARSVAPVTVAIAARRVGDKLVLTVEDDAKGGTASCVGEGIGLKNVRDRLTARFDGAAGYASGARPGGGFKVEIVIPVHADD